jgi:hypothetical protein
VDLILNVDWDTLVVPTAAQKTDRVTLGNSSGSSRPDGGAGYETIPIPKGRAAEPVAEVHAGDTGSAGTSSTGIGSTVLIVLVFLAVGAVIATLFLTRAASR